MFISQELRKKNIAEYLLYMWQIEDIIRAYDCSWQEYDANISRDSTILTSRRRK